MNFRAALLAVLIVPPSIYGKGDMTRIEIKGANLANPIEITDPRVKEFTPWAGPGVTINGVKQTMGFIIEWAAGKIADRPEGITPYQVLFYAKLHGQPEGAKEELVHVVLYANDTATG